MLGYTNNNNDSDSLQLRVGNVDATLNFTGNSVCAEIGDVLRPASNIVNLTCHANGQYIVLRKKMDGWWAINELYAEIDGSIEN